MSLVFKIALRNLIRSKRRTIFTLISISAGLAMILWLQCILAGRNKNMIDSITSKHTGHLQVYRSNYLEDRLIQNSFDLSLENLLKLLPIGSSAAPRVYLPALISSGENSFPIYLQGIDPLAEPQVTQNKVILSQGDYLEPELDPACPSRQIYIGAALAKSLAIHLNSKVVLMAQAADGTLGNDLFRVKGIYSLPGADKTVAYSPLACVTKLGAIRGIHEWAIRIRHEEEMDTIRKHLESHLDPGVVSTTWRETLPQVAGMVRYNDATLLMVSSMLFMIISVGIVNTLLMSVFERTREFGVMIALGTTPFQIQKVVLAESLMIGILSSILGVAAGSLIIVYHQWKGFDLTPFLGPETSTENFKFDWVIYPLFRLSSFFKLLGGVLTLVVTAGLYPAYRASKLSAVEAMRCV